MRVLALLLFFLCVAVPVRAAGFEGPGVSPTVTRAADVLDAQDDAPCVLEGHILEKIPFRKTGTCSVTEAAAWWWRSRMTFSATSRSRRTTGCVLWAM